MTNNNTFPNTEPPPHPGDAKQNENIENLDPKLASAMLPGELQNPTQQPQQQPVQQAAPQEIKSYKSSKSPKVLIISLLVLGLIVIIGAFALFFKPNNQISLVGTKGELVWWGVENSESVIEPLIEEYQDKNPNVKITYIQQSEQDYRERLTSSLAQGKGPDVFEIHNSWVPMFKTELSVVPGGILDSELYKKSFYPIVSKDFLTTGGPVSIPLEYDALAMFYNQDIFDSAALPLPETWDDVVDISKRLTQYSGKQIILQSGVALGLTDNVDYWQDIVALMIVQNGGNLEKPTSKTVDAINFYKSFFVDNNVWNTSLPSSVSAFSKNKLALLIAPTKVAKEIIVENPTLRFKTFPMPQLPKNEPTDPDFTYASYWSQSVWARSKNSEVAWDFLKFLSTGESLQKMNSLRKSNGILEKAYPRPDMAILQKEDKILGSIVNQAGKATSWYLNDKTFDGPTGINSQIGELYKKIVDLAIEGKNIEKNIEALPIEIKTILNKYTQKK